MIHVFAMLDFGDPLAKTNVQEDTVLLAMNTEFVTQQPEHVGVKYSGVEIVNVVHVPQDILELLAT